MRAGIAGLGGMNTGRIILLTFCPITQMGRRRRNGPPPAHEVIAHERFSGYDCPCGQRGLRRQAAAQEDQDPRRLPAEPCPCVNASPLAPDRESPRAAPRKRPPPVLRAAEQ